MNDLITRDLTTLIDALSYAEPTVRKAAADEMRALKDERALHALATHLVLDPHPHVRGACARALGELDDPQALEALEFATRRESDVYAVILIERAILKIIDRQKSLHEEACHADTIQSLQVAGAPSHAQRRGEPMAYALL